jgi:hypothetical protein
VITLASRKRFLFVGATIVAPFVAQVAHAQARSCSIAFPETSATAKWTTPLDRPVVARMSVLSLRAALDRLAALAGIRLSYSAELLPLDRAVCLSSDGLPIGRVLDELLTGTNVGAVAVGADQVVLAPRAPRAVPAAPVMSLTTSVLDSVVVTGSTMGAPERELTVGLDVLDGRQLARENTRTLAGALNGYVPGIWSWPQSPASMLSSYGSIRGASSFGLSYPKIYIDGIEVANPLLVSRLSMDAIDRVEVIRGPQGSALYGTDAISGVINIVTRHEGTGVDGEHASLRTTAGYIRSDFASPVFTQNHALSLVSGSSTRSADLHISGGTVGNFIPGGFSRDLMAMGSARVVGARTTWSTTARYVMQEAGSASSPLFKRPTTPDSLGRAFAAQDSLPQSINQYTIGTTATFAADDRWTHSATAGFDGYSLANVKANSTPIPSVALQDSALLAAQGSATRGTLRASSVLRLGTTEENNATITFSAEHGVFRSSSFNAPTEPLPNLPGPGGVTNKGGMSGATQLAQPRRIVTWQNSTGLITQANASLNNTFYFTGGLRLERDSRLADDVALLPMLGAAAVRNVGPFTMKLRGAYGEGIRPPSTFGHIELWQGAYSWNAKQSLGPEKQAGTELGLDVMLRRAWSMRVTRFDQRASGLIQLVAVPADTGRFSRRVRYDLENVGEISNNGWELESSANISRLTLSGTLSLVDSRVKRVANGYRGDLVAGDHMLQVPARTLSANAAWQGRGWFASMGATRAFDWINYDELALANAYVNGDHMAHDITGAQLRQYWRRYNGALHVRAAASRDVRDLFTLEVSGENLLDYQRNEPDNLTILPGRTIMTGVKLKF